MELFTLKAAEYRGMISQRRAEVSLMLIAVPLYNIFLVWVLMYVLFRIAKQLF